VTRVAAVQYEPAFMDKAQNTALLLRLAEEAARAGAELVVLPEMATTGYVFRSREEVAPFVEPVPGPTTRAFGRLAASRGVSVVLGLAEVDATTGAYYNSAVLIGPGGEVAGRYRKTHSFFCDTLWSAEGDLGLPVFEGPWPGPLGILICMDACYFEPARVMALRGARVLAFPTNWLGPAPAVEWRTRAAENGLFLVAADRWGEERGVRFAGGSCVIGPSGEVLAVKDRGDGVVLADIDLGQDSGLGSSHGSGHVPGGRECSSGAAGRTAAAGPGAASGPARPRVWAVVRRRPGLYHDLLRHPYLWPETANFGRLGTGRFWLGAVEGPAGDSCALPPLPGEPGRRVAVLPPGYPAGTLVEAAARSGAYLTAAVAAPSGEGAGAGAEVEEVVLVGPDGPVGRYRSPHLTAGPSGRPASGGRPPACPDGPASPGPAEAPFPVFDLPFARVGLLHVVDLLLPEPARCLAKRGADVILAAGTLGLAAFRDLEFLWAERALGSNVWLALACEEGAGVFPGEPSARRGGSPGESSAEGRRAAGDDRAAGRGPTSDRAPFVRGLNLEAGPGSPSRRKDMLRRLRPDLYISLVGAGDPRRGSASGRKDGHRSGT